MIREVTGTTCLPRSSRTLPAHLQLAKTQQSQQLKSYVFGSNAETIQQKDRGQKLNPPNGKHLNHSSNQMGAWMPTPSTPGRSLSIFVCYIFSVEEYISQKRISFWLIQTPIYSTPNENKPGRVILLTQMPPVLLSVFRLTTTM